MSSSRLSRRLNHDEADVVHLDKVLGFETVFPVERNIVFIDEVVPPVLDGSLDDFFDDTCKFRMSR